MQTELKTKKVVAVLLVVSMLFAYSLFFDQTFALACDNPLTACISVCSYYQKYVNTDYDWTLDKGIKPASITVNQGKNENVAYTLTATRVENTTVTENKGANVTVKVTNPECYKVCGYTIKVQLQKKDGCNYINVGNPDVKTGQNLNGKSSTSFSYSFTNLEPGTTYRIKVVLTYDGDNNEYTKDFSLPSPTTRTEIKDKEATVTDSFTAKPAGFTITGGLGSVWEIKEGDLKEEDGNIIATKKYTVNVANVNAEAGKSFALKNKAILTENDSKCKRCDEETVTIITNKYADIIASIPTAASFWNKGASYDWEIEKIANPTSITFNKDEKNVKDITYTLTATRKVNQSSEDKGITGTVKVTNNGNEETKGLKIKVQLQAKKNGSFQDVAGASDEIKNAQVAAGKSEQYTFSIPYTGLAENTEYRVVSTITADNFEGTATPESSPFTASPTLTTSDEEASVQDNMGSLAGFEITSEFTNVWTIKGSDLDKDNKATKTYKVKVKNVNADDDKCYILNNTATITENDSGEQDTSDATVNITVPKAGITLCTSVSAVNAWKKTTEYDWTIEKVASPTTLTVNLNDEKKIEYTLTATRNIDNDASSEEKAVSGKVKVTNNGKEATNGLKIVVQLQQKGFLGVYSDVGSAQTITPDEQLAAGTTKEYPFKITYSDLEAGKDYRVVATTTANNFLEGTAEATSDKFEANPVVTTTDEEATVEDDFVDVDKLDGFVLDGGLEDDWKIAANDLKDGKVTKTYTVTVTNEDAEGGKDFTLKNEAIITENDSHETHKAVEEVTLKTELKSTKLEADLTAVGYWNAGITYDWTIEKKVNPDYVRFTSKSSTKGKKLEYTLIATRKIADEDNDYGVKGKITVENTGKVPTENLEINLQVMYNKGDGWKELSGATETIKPSSQLAAGAKKEYEYSIDKFEPVKGADDYKVVAEVTITNYLGKGDKAAGIEEENDFSFPKNPQEDVTDETAVVEDDFTKIPTGFRVSGGLDDEWEIEERDLEKSGSKWIAEKTYSVTLYNESARYNNTYELVNKATLKESDSRKTRTDEARVSISTKKSSPPPEPPKPPVDDPPEDPIDVPEDPVEPYTPPTPPAEPITPPVEPEPTLPNTGGNPAAFVTLGMSLVAYGSWLRFKK